jgi:hypothetical protein
VGLKQVTRNKAARLQFGFANTSNHSAHASQDKAIDKFLCASIMFGRYYF